jgi:hypothetical protein
VQLGAKSLVLFNSHVTNCAPTEASVVGNERGVCSARMLSTGGTQRKGTCLFISNNNQPKACSFGRFSFQHNNILLYPSHFRTRKPQIGPSEVCLHAQLFVKRKSAYCHICVLRAKISTSKSIKCPKSNEKESLASLEEAFESALRVVWDRKPKGYWSSIE